MTPNLARLLALLAVAVLVTAGCGDDDASTTADAASSPGADLEGAITVAAATSLTGAFGEIGEDFAAAHTDVEVTFTFDASSALATQILEGAPADVVALADEATMARITDEGLVAGEPEVVATNELVIVTKPGNPQGIEGLDDLAGAGVISLCGEEVPCGRYAAEVLGDAGVTIDESSVTRGQNVGATLTAVTEGDAVAGIVYATDAAGAGDAVEALEIPDAVDVVARYPIGALEGSGSAEVATAFVEFVLGEEGQAVLAEHGFLPPA